MFLKFICCDVFARIACELVAKSPNVVDLEFIPMLAHVEPVDLRNLIQEKINTTTNQLGRRYDAIILGFGICGNAVMGLSGQIPIIIPRAHDCCTLLMGSKEKFLSAFGNTLSSRWCSTGYYERTFGYNSNYQHVEQMDNYKTSPEYIKYLEDYDEETADYLWETLHPKIESHESVYIEIEGQEYSDACKNYKETMDRLGIDLRVVSGDISFLEALVSGDWDESKFLYVPPGKVITGVYDMEEVMRAV